MTKARIDLYFADDLLAREDGVEGTIATFARVGFVATRFGKAKTERGLVEKAAQLRAKPSVMPVILPLEGDGFSVALMLRSGSKDAYGTQILGDFEVDDEAIGARIVKLVETLCATDEPAWGVVHDFLDFELADPKPPKLLDAFWLMVLGKSLVEACGGKAKVVATPGARVVELPQGGVVLVIGGDSPATATTPAARAEQAIALAHLNPKMTVETARARTAKRDAQLGPSADTFDPDLRPVFEAILAQTGSAERGALATQFAAHTPAPVTELVTPLPKPNSDAAKQRTLLRGEIEKLIVVMHDKVPGLVTSSEPSVLPRLDAQAYAYDYPSFVDPDELKNLARYLGAFLGDMLVRHLGGTWIPRTKVAEIAAAIGDTAFLPFVRATNFLASKQAAIDSSLTQFYAEAARRAASTQKPR